MSSDPDTPSTDKRDAYTEDGDAKVNVSTVTSDLVKDQSSTQLPERRVQTHSYGIRPPYNPDRLAAFLERNETHAVSVRKKARYEVGFGFDIVPAADVDVDEADDLERAVVENFWRGSDSRWLTGPRETREPTTPSEVKELARQDHHAIGWEALEILVNAEGVPVGLAHVPANTVRVRKPSGDETVDDVRGYIQKRNGKTRYFGVAGDRYRGLDAEISGTEDDPEVRYTPDDTDEEPKFVDKETGDVVQGDASELPNGPANELIFIRNPSPIEQDYGIPDWVSSIRTIAADEAAKDYNREFFDNDTIPRFVIKVTGGELTEESKQDLKQMLHGLREESHRAVILEVEKFEAQLDEEVEIELEPLGQGISEEMDFRLFRERNEHEIAKVHEVPPILIGLTNSNYSDALVQKAEFATEVIGPEQHKFATRLYKTIHQTALGVDDWTVEYTLKGADQPKEDAEVARRKIQAVNGAIPVNRALDMIGEEPLSDEFPVDGDTTLVADVGRDPSPPPGGGGPPPRDAEAALPPQENKVGERDWEDVEAALATKEIEQTQFASSNLAEGLYDFDDQELYLSFKREGGQNSLYAYVNVPPNEWAGLTNAGSAGGYHYDSIRLEYPYVEITNFHDRLPEGPSPSADEMPDDVPL